MKNERHLVLIIMGLVLAFAAKQVRLFFLPVSVAAMARWALLSLGVLHCMYTGKPTVRRCPQLRRSRSDTALALMLAAFLASAMASDSVNKSLIYWGVCALQVILLTRWMRALSVKGWRKVMLIAAATCAGVSMAGALGYGADPDRFSSAGRLAGLSNANSMGLVAMIGCLLCLALYLFETNQEWSKSWLPKLYLAGAISCVAALWFSSSRSSMAGLAAGALVIQVLSGRYQKPLIITLLALAGLWLALHNTRMNKFAASQVQTRIMRGEGGNIFSDRENRWESAYRQWLDAPWLGHGYATTGRGIAIDGSGYVGLLASVGILGAVGFALPILSILALLVQEGKKAYGQKSLAQYAPEHRQLLALSAGPLVALLVQGVGEPWMLGPGSFMQFIYWLCVGGCLTATGLMQRPLKKDRQERGKRHAQVSRPALARMSAE